jgi:hypothetical protein
MDIRFLKLSNGETILADILGMTETVITVVNPVEISIKGLASNYKASMIGYQWLPLLEDENIIEISWAHVIALQEATLEVKQFYVDVVDQYIYPENYEEQDRENELEDILNELQGYANSAGHNFH